MSFFKSLTQMAKQGVSAVAAKVDPTAPYRAAGHAICYAMMAVAVMFVIFYISGGMTSSGYLIAAAVLAGLAFGALWVEKHYYPSYADQINSAIDTTSSIVETVSPFVTDAPQYAPQPRIAPQPFVPTVNYPPPPEPTYDQQGAVGGDAEGGLGMADMRQMAQKAQTGVQQAAATFRAKVEGPLRNVARTVVEGIVAEEGVHNVLIPIVMASPDAGRPEVVSAIEASQKFTGDLVATKNILNNIAAPFGFDINAELSRI